MRKNVFKTLIGAAAAAMVLGAAVGVTMSAPKASQKAEAAGVSGTITIDTTKGDWAENNSDGTGQNFSVYFYNGTTSGWGDYIFGAYQQYLVEIPYSLSFTPTNMIAVRYSPWLAKTGDDSWTSNPWRSDTWGKWNQTADLSFSENSNIIVGNWNETNKNNDATVGYAYMLGKGTDTGWEWTDPWVQFTNVKLNGSNHAEYYLTRTFKKWDEFGVQINGDEWCSSATYSSFVDTDDWTMKGNNIQYIGEGGSFALYFDRNSSSIYITDPVAAAADEWAQKFLGTKSSSDNCTYTKTNWDTNAGSYSSDLSAEAKQLFVDEEHVSHDAPTSTYLAKAVQRYDYVLERYGVYDAVTNPDGYTDFIGRVAANKITIPSHMGIFGTLNNSTNNTFLIVTITTISAVAAIGVFFFIKKKKEDR